ncbi:hypothetical protein RJJ92_29455 [Rhizobium redzepovicii]|uniref:hypothetical protein n=1 Tax=Rhizobium redzepovicii TaxID=2867518 RepID=UPI0028715FC3|nr:hypothetical protein [Rhizobium redzepovicii]MDR9784758.1 hypothetical protein [Rhizobium redzepovicii]
MVNVDRPTDDREDEDASASDELDEITRPAAHELATSILVDVSLSTDSWIDNRRVLDVEMQALDIFARGLDACGHSFAIHTFTSTRRNWVRVETIKGFSEKFSAATAHRIASLKPGYYTHGRRHPARFHAARPARSAEETAAHPDGRKAQRRRQLRGPVRA